MRIPSPDDAALAAAERAARPVLRAGVPLPACLLGIEALRLLAGVSLAAASLALVGPTAQGLLFVFGALSMVWSSLMLIPVYRSESRSWAPELADYYRVRARRMRSDGAAGRTVRLLFAGALTLALPLAVAHGAEGLPVASVPVGAGVALMLWVDIASLYAACLPPEEPGGA